MDLNLKKEQEKYLVSDYSGSDTTDEFYNISTFAKNMVIKDSLKYDAAEEYDIADPKGIYKFSLSNWFGNMLIQYCEKGLSDVDILALLGFIKAYNEVVDENITRIDGNLRALKTKDGKESNYQSIDMAIIGECFPNLSLEDAIDPVTKRFYPDSGVSYGSLLDLLKNKERIYIKADPFPDMANETEKTIATPYERQLIDNGCPLVFFDLRIIAGEDKRQLRDYLIENFQAESRVMAASLSTEVAPVKLHLRILYKELNQEYRKDLNCDSIEMALFRPTLRADGSGGEKYDHTVLSGMEAYLNISEKRSTCITSMAVNFVRTIQEDKNFIKDIYSYKYNPLPPLTVKTEAGSGYINTNEVKLDRLCIKVNGKYILLNAEKFRGMATSDGDTEDNTDTRLNSNYYYICLDGRYYNISIEDIGYVYEKDGENFNECPIDKWNGGECYAPIKKISRYNVEEYTSLNPDTKRYCYRKMVKSDNSENAYREVYIKVDTQDTSNNPKKPNPLVIYYTRYSNDFAPTEFKLDSFRPGKDYFIKTFKSATEVSESDLTDDNTLYRLSDEYSYLQYDAFGRIYDNGLFYSYQHLHSDDEDNELVQIPGPSAISYALKLYNNPNENNNIYIALEDFGDVSNSRTYYSREIDYVEKTTQLYKYGYGNPYLARVAKESELVYYYMGDNYVSNGYGKYAYEREDISDFLSIYQQTREYYYRVLLNESFINEQGYKTYEKLFLIFWAMERFLTNKLERRTDIDSYSKKDIQNFLESYGMDELSKIIVDSGNFGDIEPYAKKLLKSYKELVQNKGSKNILDILKGIFSIDNTELTIYKNILYKQRSKDEDGNTKFNYKMVSVNHDSQTLIKDVLAKLGSSPTAEEYIKPKADSLENGDIYWKVSLTDGSLDDIAPSMTTTKYLDVEFLNEISNGYFLTGYVLSILDYFLKVIEESFTEEDRKDTEKLREKYAEINQGPSADNKNEYRSFWMGQILLSNSAIFEPESVTLREALYAFRSLLWVYYERVVSASADKYFDLTKTYPMTTFHFDPKQLYEDEYIFPIRKEQNEPSAEYFKRLDEKYGKNPYLNEYEDCKIATDLGIHDGHAADSTNINNRDNNALMVEIHKSITVLYELAKIELEFSEDNKPRAIGDRLKDITGDLVTTLNNLLILPKALMDGKLYNIDMSSVLYNQIKRIHDACYMREFEDDGTGSKPQDIRDRVYSDAELFKIIQNTYVGETADDAKYAIGEYAEYLNGVLDTALSYNLLNSEHDLLVFVKSCIDYFISYTSQIHSFTYRKLYNNKGETAGIFKDTYKITEIRAKDADAFYYDEQLNIKYVYKEAV